MELIELDATAQRALELLTNAGKSDGSIYDYGPAKQQSLFCSHVFKPARQPLIL